MKYTVTAVFEIEVEASSLGEAYDKAERYRCVHADDVTQSARPASPEFVDVSLIVEKSTRIPIGSKVKIGKDSNFDGVTGIVVGYTSDYMMRILPDFGGKDCIVTLDNYVKTLE